MTRDEVLNRLRPCEPELRSSGLAALYLFGSTARNEAEAGSDVDLAFELGEAPGFSLLTQAGLMIRLAAILDRPVELIAIEGLRPRIRKRVDAERVQVF